MRIISYNVNGIRAAMKKGFTDWLATDPADIICLQETKANKEDADVAAIEKLGYHTFWFSAQKKGYSGVAIFTKIKPDNVIYGNGIEQSDAEGRVIRADLAISLSSMPISLLAPVEMSGRPISTNGWMSFSIIYSNSGKHVRNLLLQVITILHILK